MGRHYLILAAAGLGLAGAWYGVQAAVPPAQLMVLPGSASSGEQLLVEKGCVRCHGTGAPDLTRTPPDAGSPGLLATAMWNHTPDMWTPGTELTSAEAADLFAYMYSALYFAPNGDVGRGGRVFEEKNCANCHSDTPVADTNGRAISAWTSVTDPTAWAGRMWNHAADMSEAMLQSGFAWPTLSNQDVADLMVYLRSLPALRDRSATFGMGEPEQGRVVYERSCESCHSFGPGVGTEIDLLRRRAPQTVMGYIASMWNHAEVMLANSGENFPELDPEEMPHLIAFLFSQAYFFERGDAARGRSVFEEKNCASCHERGRSETGAPDLTQSAELYSPITLISAVWDHVPVMLEAIRRDDLAWPLFQGSEMTDLIAYLNSQVTVRIAAPPGN